MTYHPGDEDRLLHVIGAIWFGGGFIIFVLYEVFK